MPSLEIPVSLAEALEVRGSVLTENEAWGVLSQTAESLQDLFIKGTAFTSEGLSFVITPETLLLNSNGRVSFMESTRVDGSYVAPEYKDNIPSSDGSVDKIYVYSLGRTLNMSTTYGLTHQSQVPKLSRNLDNLFGAMCELDPSHRLALVHVLEACTLHAQKKSNRKSSSNYVVRLHKMVLGGNLSNSLSTFNTSYGSDISGLTFSTERSNRRPLREGRRQTRRTSNRSRSRSRSRSRNRDIIESDHQSYRLKSNPDRDSGIGTLRECDIQHRKNDHFMDAQSIYFATLQNPKGAEGISKTTTLPANLGNQLPNDLLDQTISQQRAVEYPSGQYPPGYEKYLQLKERQHRLRAVRGGRDQRPLSFRQPGNSDVTTDTKSLHSLMSYTAGTYLPDLHPSYGSEVAYRPGQSSDQDSISTDISMIADPNALRASKDLGYSTLPKAPVRKKRQKHVEINPHIQTDYIGPEFVHNTTKPPVRIPMPLQGESLKNASHARRVIIVHLTGQKFETICDPSTNGRQLFDVVISHIALPEYYFFGLTYVTDSEHFFIEPDTKLHKVAPDGWKESAKGHAPVLTFTVYVRVKYYVDSITDIRHDDSYHLLYLQLRRDIIEDRFYCTDDQALALAGLALQVEFGDYNMSTMGTVYFVLEQYFGSRVMRKLGQQYLRENALIMHKNLHGHPPSQSELEYIKCIQKLPEYGIHYYKLLRNKNDTMSTVWVGISSRNLLISENQGHERVIVQRHPWQSTQKISFNKRRFSVQPKPDYGIPKPAKINLYSNTYRKGRYLLQLSTAQHRFQMRMRTRPSNTETLQVGEMVGETTCSLTAGLTDDSLEGEDITVDNKGSSVYDSSLDTGSIRFVPDVRSQGPPLKYRSPPPYRTGLSYSMDDLRDPFPLGQVWSNTIAVSNMELHRPTSTHGNLHDELLTHDEQYNIGVNRVGEEPQQSNISNNHKFIPHKPYADNALLSNTSIPGRHVMEVTLRKEEHHGIGMTIVGGESTGKLDLGIFVKTVAPGGPAERCGQIFPGDRIIAINDLSLEGVQHHDAVHMIRDSGKNVTLLLSKVRAPRTLRRRHLEPELSDELEEIAKSSEDLHLETSKINIINRQLSHSMDDLAIKPPKKPVRTRKTQEIEVVGELLRQLSQAENMKQTVPTDHVIIEPTNQEQLNIERSAFKPEDIISGNLSNHQSPRLVSTIDIYDEAARPDNMDILDDEVISSQELQMVGEIAEMPAINDSSSDSDFDSAIHDVIQGKSRKHKSTDKSKHVRDELPTSNSENTSLQSADYIYSHITSDNIYEVDLTKGSNGFGFSIQGGTDVHPTDPKQCIPRVKKIFMLGPAAESEIMRAGDVILRVENKQLKDLTKNEIIEMMHTTPKQVRLLMYRPDPTVLPPIERSDSIDSLEALLHSRQVRLSASFFQDHLDSLSESETSTINSGRSSPFISVNRNQNNANKTALTPDVNKTPILRRSWTDQQIVSPPLEASSRDISGILVRSQSEQVPFDVTSPPISSPTCNLEKYLIEDNKSTYISSSMMSPYGNFENLAALCSSDDYVPHDSSEAGSAWSDVDNVSQEHLRQSPAQTLPDTSPTKPNFDNYLIVENKSKQFSSKMSPYGNLENLAALSFSDDFPEHDSSEIGSAWSDIENISKEQHPGASYTSPKIEPRNSTLLSESDVLGHMLPGGEIESRKSSNVVSSTSLVNTDCNKGQAVLDHISVSSVSSLNSTRETIHDDLCTGNITPQCAFSFSAISLEDYKLQNQTEKKTEDSTEKSVVKSEINPHTKQSNSGEASLEKSNSRDVILEREHSYSSSDSNVDNDLRKRNMIIQSTLRRQSKVHSDDDHVNSDNNVNNKTEQPVINQNVHKNCKSVDDIDSCLNLGEFEVTLLKRDGGGLGFAVAGSGQSRTGCYIKDVIQDPALSDGRLQVGDQLIEINGQGMSNMNHFEAVTLLRQTPRLVRIKAYRATDKSSPKNIKTGAMKNEIMSQELMVSKTIPRVNHDDIESESDEDTGGKIGNVLQMIKSLETRKQSDSETGSRSSVSLSSESGIVRINLLRPRHEGFGFSLISAETENVSGVFVRTIKGGGAAYIDGRLQVGDRILQVNDESVLGYNHTRVIGILRQVDHEVNLTVTRSLGKPTHLHLDEDKENKVYLNRPIDKMDSLTNVCDLANETDEDISSLAGTAEDFLKQNGALNISLLTPRDTSFDKDTLQYKSPRKIPVVVPEVLTNNWLNSLPLLSISEDGEEFIGEALHSLVENVEQEEPFEEFKNLCHLKATDECIAANLSENKMKNRYRNVLPYDINRVVLEEREDYINGSHIKIDVDDGRLWYISCQGPLPNTIDDFWQMCWEQHVSVIAMLTLDVEARKVKCHRYWPDSKDEIFKVCNGQYEVRLESIQRLTHFDIRYLNIGEKRSGKEKRLVHLNYTTWPDHGTPCSAIPLLQFIRLIHLIHNGGPIVVHCSAGIGRSGALIAIDTALLNMEHMKQFSIFDIVKELRQQRYGFIQTKDQYLFCYTACMQVLLSVSS